MIKRARLHLLPTDHKPSRATIPDAHALAQRPEDRAGGFFGPDVGEGLAVLEREVVVFC